MTKHVGAGQRARLGQNRLKLCRYAARPGADHLPIVYVTGRHLSEGWHKLPGEAEPSRVVLAAKYFDRDGRQPGELRQLFIKLRPHVLPLLRLIVQWTSAKTATGRWVRCA